MENVINSSKSSKSNTSSEKDVKDEAIALLDKRLEDMTVNLQAALDVSAENFSKRVAALEATLAAVQAHGTSLKVSEPTKESIAAAATKRELRKALLTGIDEHVAASDLEGDLPKLLHIERRKAFVVGAATVAVTAGATVATTLYVQKRRAAKAEEPSTEAPEVASEQI